MVVFRRRRPASLLLFCWLLVGPLIAGCGADRGPWVEVGGERIYVEVADSPQERTTGLMFRTALEEDEGMLFVFPEQQMLSFWMKDTSIPLSIAYLDPNGVILEIHDMEPYSLEPVPSRQPALFALEVPQGTFDRLGVGLGARIVLPNDLSAQR